MIFLNPAVLFGLLAAAIPVLIHLLNLRKLKQIEFSTLSFLKELQKNKIRKLKLKQWLLLALRVLLVLLIVTAFARPTLKGIALGGTTSAAKTTAVFILDDTFSMSVVTPGGSHFNQAKETALNLIENLQEGDEAALVLVSNDEEEVSSTGNFSELVRKIKELEFSHASGTLDRAIIKAAGILGESRNFNKEIYIISDYQSGRLSEDGNFSDLGELLNENVKVYAFNLPDKEVLNLSINELQLNTTIFEKDKPVSFNVTVRNNSDRTVNDQVVSLFINGERSAQQSVTLGNFESQTVNIESPVSSTGFIDVIAEIEDDDILTDNKRYITFNIPEEIHVGIFASDLQDVKFVETALSAYGNESSLKLKKMNFNQFTSINPEQFSVIIICGDGTFNGIERLNTFVENGGGLIVLPGENSTPERFNNLLGLLKLPAVEGISGTLNQTRNASVFEKISFEHPLFQDIFTASQKKQIESPDIYYSFKIKPAASGSSIISLNNVSSFLTEYRIGIGKVLLYNTAPVLSWSNFPLKSIFPPLVNRSVYYLSAKAGSENSFIAGEDVNIYLGKGVYTGVQLKRPDNSEEFITVPETNNGYIQLTNTTSAGIYKFLTENTPVQQAAVNTDPRESITEQLETGEVEQYLEKVNFKGHFYSVPANENPSQVILQARFGSELWKYFVFGAILIALTEMAIARTAKREAESVTKGLE